MITKARAFTSNTECVYNIQYVEYEKHEFILASGNGYKLDIFNLDQLRKTKNLGKKELILRKYYQDDH